MSIQIGNFGRDVEECAHVCKRERQGGSKTQVVVLKLKNKMSEIKISLDEPSRKM